MTAIRTVDLSKKYKNKYVVKNLNLSVDKGEIFALLGTNGAGKTTTVKMLSTLIQPSEGTAFIEEMNISSDCMKIKEIINVSPQETAIAGNLTVRENLEFMAGVYSIKYKKEKIENLIEMFGLDEVLSQKAKTLSGGWQRKLSIAISLINDPHILFLDEPTLGLDVISRKELWRVIEGLRGKVTVILTTHYMEEAESLCDRVGIMSHGKLIALGTSEEIKKLAGKEKFEDAFEALVMGDKQ